MFLFGSFINIYPALIDITLIEDVPFTNVELVSSYRVLLVYTLYYIHLYNWFYTEIALRVLVNNSVYVIA